MFREPVGSPKYLFPRRLATFAIPVFDVTHTQDRELHLDQLDHTHRSCDEAQDRVILFASMGGHRSIKGWEPRGIVKLIRPDGLDPDGRVKYRVPAEEDWLRHLKGDDWREGLVAAREMRGALEYHEIRLVRIAREEGVDWLWIAQRLALTRQGARQRFLRRLTPVRVRYPATMSLDDLYREVILDHYRAPRNKKHVDGAPIDVHRNNPLCGDDITVRVVVDPDGLAQDVSFEGQGCSISQASASMLTEQIKGKSVEQIDDLVLKFRRMMAGEEDPGEEELGDLVALKGVVKYPVRIKCAVLAWDALQEGVTQYQAHSL